MLTTFGSLARRNGVNWADKPAFIALERQVTWGELDQRSDALGHAYRALGVMPGDRVAILTHDAIEVPECFLAAAKIGAIRVGLNPRLAALEIAALIEDCEPALLIYAGEFQALVELAAPQLAAMKTLPAFIGFGAGHGASLDYEELIARHSRDGRLGQTPHEHVMIAYTSGSTGLPKGAIYPHEKFLRTILYTAMNEGLVHDSVWLQAMPAAGVPMMHMLRNIFLASTCVILGPWNPERALSMIDNHRVTHCVLVPTMLTAMLRVPDFASYDVGSMQLLAYGAAPLPPATIREALVKLRCPFLQMYGTTELLGMTNMLYPSDHELGLSTRPELLSSVGRPLSWVDVRIVDEENKDLPDGEIGEVVVRSDLVFSGYWRAPEKSGEVFFGDWFRTGDLGRRDKAGYFYISDRVKFRIKTGGYNVFPTEVENVLAEHPGIHEVSVFGLPDNVWGDRIEAVVSLKPGAEVAVEALKEFCKDKIATFKIPKHIEIWDELPKGSTGKILKRAVIEIMVERYAREETTGN
jgi:acyl-CoA synthetase (AMP-forming)/AMP-acid ligase II